MAITKSNTKKVTTQIDWPNIRQLRKVDTPWKKIAEATGYSAQYLRKEFSLLKNLSPLVKDPEATEDYKKNRADILADMGRRLLAGVTPEKIEKARVGELILAHAQISDKERLERGQATQNVAHINILKKLEGEIIDINLAD
jgi:hypothetical protein